MGCDCKSSKEAETVEETIFLSTKLVEHCKKNPNQKITMTGKELVTMFTSAMLAGYFLLNENNTEVK